MSYQLDSSDCVIDSFFGSTHPYNFCIKPAAKVMKESTNRDDCDKFGFNCIADNIVGFGKYSASLFANPSLILDPSCINDYPKDDPKNILGNKYVIKTSSKCITDNQEIVDRHIYINNTKNNEIFGIKLGDNPDNVGILPASLSKATRINGAGFFYSLIEDGLPNCEEVKVKCHLLDKYKDKYSGPSPPVHIAKNEIESIRKNNNLVEGFSNNILDNNNNNNNNNNINDAYYLLIAIIILYVIFKMIHKK